MRSVALWGSTGTHLGGPSMTMSDLLFCFFFVLAAKASRHSADVLFNLVPPPPRPPITKKNKFIGLNKSEIRPRKRTWLFFPPPPHFSKCKACRSPAAASTRADAFANHRLSKRFYITMHSTCRIFVVIPRGQADSLRLKECANPSFPLVVKHQPGGGGGEGCGFYVVFG